MSLKFKLLFSMLFYFILCPMILIALQNSSCASRINTSWVLRTCFFKRTISYSMFSYNSCNLDSICFYTISVVQRYQNFLLMVSFLDDLWVWFLSHKQSHSLAEKPSNWNALKWEMVCKKRDSYLSSCKVDEMHCFDLMACKNCMDCKLKVASISKMVWVPAWLFHWCFAFRSPSYFDCFPIRAVFCSQ